MKKQGGNKRSFSAVFSVSFVLLAAKIIGFIKQIVVANAFGATTETDIIALSQGVITDFEFLIAQTMITAFIPIYISVKERQSGEKRFVSNVIKLFAVISFGISTLVFLLSPMITKIIAPSFKGDVAVSLTHNIRIYSYTLVLLTITAIFNALLKANQSFLPGEITSIIQSVSFIICVYIFGSIFSVKALIISFFVYVTINAFYLTLYSRKFWRIEWKVFSFDDDVKKLLKMISPLLFGYAMIYINQMVDKILATGIGDGAVTSMSYSSVLGNFITGFIASICGVAFTYVASNVAQKSDKKAATIVGYFVTCFVTVLIPVTLITVINAKEIVTIVYGRGAYDATAVENSAFALMGYGSMFIQCAIREMFTRLQYSYQESRKPTINNTISIIANIVLSIVLSRLWGILGITIATSVSVLISAVLNVISSRKYNSYLHIRFFNKYWIPWIIGGIACLSTDIILTNHLTIENLYFRFVIICISSFVAYGIPIAPIAIGIVKKRTSVFSSGKE